jgi:hypothetical protein
LEFKLTILVAMLARLVQLLPALVLTTNATILVHWQHLVVHLTYHS